ncbi:Protein-arginine deiminase type-1 [Saguinus oedipus]|uniref:Protein-arginine deiminase type-1 n=1 Tax=Saguinus oedipus TaxID=9490 RepID=A0ABQ9V9Z8_SAGOE|nr:Protein-arginine deiminase type-1 [Saguinus oedipus]
MCPPLPLPSPSLKVVAVWAEDCVPQVKVSYFGEQEGRALGHSVLYLTGVDISLDVDTGRTGKVERSRGDKTIWRWGPEGYGAILMVNCDRDNHRSTEPDLTHSQLTSLAGE